jgi:hypothetical protein
MTEKINTLVFALSAAIVAALSMLILGVLGNIGLYEGAVEMMMKWHMLSLLSSFLPYSVGFIINSIGKSRRIKFLGGINNDALGLGFRHGTRF